MANRTKEPAFEGKYQCEGLDEGYKGEVVIDKVGEGFQLQWIFANREHHSGVGFHDGNQLVANWNREQKPRGQEPMGVVLYRVDNDGLVGTYICGLDDERTLRREKLTRVPKST